MMDMCTTGQFEEDGDISCNVYKLGPELVGMVPTSRDTVLNEILLTPNGVSIRLNNPSRFCKVTLKDINRGSRISIDVNSDGDLDNNEAGSVWFDKFSYMSMGDTSTYNVFIKAYSYADTKIIPCKTIEDLISKTELVTPEVRNTEHISTEFSFSEFSRRLVIGDTIDWLYSLWKRSSVYEELSEEDGNPAPMDDRVRYTVRKHFKYNLNLSTCPTWHQGVDYFGFDISKNALTCNTLRVYKKDMRLYAHPDVFKGLENPFHPEYVIIGIFGYSVTLFYNKKKKCYTTDGTSDICKISNLYESLYGVVDLSSRSVPTTYEFVGYTHNLSAKDIKTDKPFSERTCENTLYLGKYCSSSSSRDPIYFGLTLNPNDSKTALICVHPTYITMTDVHCLFDMAGMDKDTVTVNLYGKFIDMAYCSTTKTYRSSPADIDVRKLYNDLLNIYRPSLLGDQPALIKYTFVGRTNTTRKMYPILKTITKKLNICNVLTVIMCFGIYVLVVDGNIDKTHGIGLSLGLIAGRVITS